MVMPVASMARASFGILIALAAPTAVILPACIMTDAVFDGAVGDGQQPAAFEDTGWSCAAAVATIQNKSAIAVLENALMRRTRARRG